MKNRINIAIFSGRILGYNTIKLLNNYNDYFCFKFVVTCKIDGIHNSDWNPPIKPLAEKLGFKVLNVSSLKNPKVLEKFKKNNIQYILNVFCDRIIPVELLDFVKFRAINFHYGKLPNYKGRFIVSHIILNDENETYITAHYMNKEVDEGDIIFEEPIPVYNTDTAKTLYLRCAENSIELIKKILHYLSEKKELPRKKQLEKGNYFPFEEPNGCKVELSWSKNKIERFIRALTFPPISNPWVEIENQKYDIIINDNKI